MLSMLYIKQQRSVHKLLQTSVFVESAESKPDFPGGATGSTNGTQKHLYSFSNNYVTVYMYLPETLTFT